MPFVALAPSPTSKRRSSSRGRTIPNAAATAAAAAVYDFSLTDAAPVPASAVKRRVGRPRSNKSKDEQEETSGAMVAMPLPTPGRYTHPLPPVEVPDSPSSSGLPGADTKGYVRRLMQKLAAAGFSTETSTNVHAELSEGATYDGVHFLIPRTFDTIETFYPYNLSLPSMVSVLCMAFAFWFNFIYNCSPLASILLFIFWRCAYDIGLGLILTYQSRYRSMSKLYDSWTAVPDSVYQRFMFMLVRAGINNKKYAVEDFPPQFNAWIAYKAIVNIVLVNDVFTYGT